MITLVLVRRIEAMLLFVLAIELLLTQRSPILAEAFLLGVAVLLMWQNLKARPSLTSHREMEQLLVDGLSVYKNHFAAGRDNESAETIIQNALDDYLAEKWVDRARTLLATYPEFLGIFEAHGGNSRGEELAGRLRRLTEINRLIRLSHGVGLRV